MYTATKRKHTVANTGQYVTEMDVFYARRTEADSHRSRCSALPAWFLKVSAPVLAAPLAAVFNQSIAAGVVPRQWKMAVITLVPKVPMNANQGN